MQADMCDIELCLMASNANANAGKQAIGRVDRDGQENAITVRHYNSGMLCNHWMAFVVVDFHFIFFWS